MADIKLLSIDEIKQFLKSANQKEYRAKQIFQWLWQKNISSFNDMTNIPQKLQEILSSNFELHPIQIYFSEQSKTDNSIKYIFTTDDNHLIEGVLIPDKKRATACISTQVGCPLKCKFCATGTLKFGRNLNYSEIYEQVFLINQQSEQIFGRKLTNIVIMGMGEPLLNLDNTLKAINLISSEKGMLMSNQRITLSTVGLTKQIKILADTKPKFNLAVSLHSAVNNKRTQIMPININNPIPKLVDALKYYHKKTNSRITFEYLLIDELTDTKSDAQALADFCKNFPSKINLIEFNPVSHIDYKKSKKQNVDAFYNYLVSKNIVVTIRRSKGQDINAACGQLALKKQ